MLLIWIIFTNILCSPVDWLDHGLKQTKSNTDSSRYIELSFEILTPSDPSRYIRDFDSDHIALVANSTDLNVLTQ